MQGVFGLRVLITFWAGHSHKVNSNGALLLYVLHPLGHEAFEQAGEGWAAYCLALSRGKPEIS
ncbi:MAG: hypothetical protein IPP22_12510 [Nitrosomonas sp.]|nr:hypothetical protein [Nitrosomonas sp.]